MIMREELKQKAEERWQKWFDKGSPETIPELLVDFATEATKELQKENKRLRLNEQLAVSNSKVFLKQLTEAKKIIKNILRVTYGEGWNYSLDWKVKAEAFLKE